MPPKKKSNFELGQWSARQALAKQLLAICQLNTAEQARDKIRNIASAILNTEE